MSIFIPFVYLKPKITLQFLSLNISVPVSTTSISFQDLPKQNSGKMIYASYSTIELSVLSLKTIS